MARSPAILPPCRWIFSLALLAGVAACATPRYQTSYRYEQPAGAAGQACVQGCGEVLAGCQAKCGVAYQACLKTLEPQVEARYSQAVERYAAELDRYRLDLQHHEARLWEYQMWLGWHHDPWWFGSRWPSPWYGPGYLGDLPDKPSRDQILARLRQEQCDQDCACLSGYDPCFLGCGGRQISETRCVANCPPGEARP